MQFRILRNLFQLISLNILAKWNLIGHGALLESHKSFSTPVYTNQKYIFEHLKQNIKWGLANIPLSYLLLVFLLILRKYIMFTYIVKSKSCSTFCIFLNELLFCHKCKVQKWGIFIKYKYIMKMSQTRFGTWMDAICLDAVDTNKKGDSLLKNYLSSQALIFDRLFILNQKMRLLVICFWSKLYSLNK